MVPDKKHTESTIQQALKYKYVNTARYMVCNAYIFGNMYGETDFFLKQRSSGYCYDIEIKITRADFFADCNKHGKHEILQYGRRTHKREIFDNELRLYIPHDKIIDHKLRPNKFFYCVPEGLITRNEIPEYAGLMYVTDRNYKSIITVKEAPFIHKDELNVEQILCEKFYRYWKKSEYELIQKEEELKQIRKSQTILTAK